MNLLCRYTHQFIFNLSIKSLFPGRPRLYFRSAHRLCACGNELSVLKTSARQVATMAIGEFDAHVTILSCTCCKKTYECEELQRIVAPNANFGFDVMVYVGEALFLGCRNGKEVQHALAEHNISISLREIDYLGRRFIVYLALAHQASREKLKQFLNARGGYILHLDGTCEGDSPHLMSSIDGLSKIVLGNLKIPSENACQIIPFLQRIQQAFGNPVALVHDMGSAILKAVSVVFPGIADYICHFHFLKDIGNDLFGHDYSTIRRHLKTHRIRTHLRKTAKGLKKIIDTDPESSDCLQRYLQSKRLHKPTIPLLPLVTAYLIISWILEAKQQSHGFGFPFDRPHFDFYLRLHEAYPDLQKLKQKMRNEASLLPLTSINKTLTDQALDNTVRRMQDKVTRFDRLREAMRIAQPDSQDGLNDEGDPDITTIKARVGLFRHAEEIVKLAATDIAYKKMVQQIDKYWDKLFADPIQVATKTGEITIQPQRTNNLLEQFFRGLKRSDRKRSGNHALTKTLKTMIAETPLVKNLNNPQYREIILNGKASLAERFSEIDIVQVRSAFTEAQKTTQRYPKGMAKVFKIPHLPKQLVNSLPKNAAIS